MNIITPRFSLTSRQTAAMERIEENNGVMPKEIQKYFSLRTLDSLEKKDLIVPVDSTLIESLESVSTEIALEAILFHDLEEGMFVTRAKLEEICADAFLLANPPAEVGQTSSAPAAQTKQVFLASTHTLLTLDMTSMPEIGCEVADFTDSGKYAESIGHLKYIDGDNEFVIAFRQGGYTDNLIYQRHEFGIVLDKQESRDTSYDEDESFYTPAANDEEFAKAGAK